MLRIPNGSSQAMVTPGRIVPLDRARSFITLSVLLHHSVLNYTWFGQGDPMRWLGFDLLVLFNDSYFMAFMFFISGLFVRNSLIRKGPALFLRDRVWRLGVPYLVSVLVLIPIAYYPTFLRYHLPGTTDLNFLHFWWHTLTVGPWPSGPAWFLWVLLALDAFAAAIWSVAPGMVAALGRLIVSARNQPVLAFVVFLTVSIAAYLPMHLAFGDDTWLEFGHFPLPIQTSRILLYAAYFLVGVGVGANDLRTACWRRMAGWQGAGRSGSALRPRSMSRFSFSSTPITTGWRISIRRRWFGARAMASPSRCIAARWRSWYRRCSCASPEPNGACSMRSGLRPTASISSTISSSSGCNTPSTIFRCRRPSSSGSCSQARCL
jgi:hypothetical protein